MTAETEKPSLERATSDYLAVSRNRAAYASEEEYARAEERAWKALSEALGDDAPESSLGSEEPVAGRA
jgi:hypothetical protein